MALIVKDFRHVVGTYLTRIKDIFCYVISNRKTVTFLLGQLVLNERRTHHFPDSGSVLF